MTCLVNIDVSTNRTQPMYANGAVPSTESRCASAREAAGIYVHVPFCSAVCPYCDFAVLRDDGRKHAHFAQALRTELGARSKETAALGAVDTVYLGGGTPSVLDPSQLTSIIEAIGERATLIDDLHIFLEANPEDIDRERLTAWRRLGIGTLSLGIQAFDDPSLATLGRRHSASQATRAVQLALDAGFDTVSVDLIYGLPDQTEAAWRRTLDRALALAPHHLACYQLTIEPRTPFAHQAESGWLEPLTGDAQATLFFLTHEHLAAHGFAGYEVSNFARGPAHRSRHNQKYWRHVPYLGLGPSAHSFDGSVRRWNERHLVRWQRRLAESGEAVAGEERLSGGALAMESLMLGLRTTDGVDLAACRQRFGIDLLDGNEATLDRQRAAGRLVVEGNLLIPTLEGMAVADAIATEWSVPATCTDDRKAS